MHCAAAYQSLLGRNDYVMCEARRVDRCATHSANHAFHSNLNFFLVAKAVVAVALAEWSPYPGDFVCRLIRAGRMVTMGEWSPYPSGRHYSFYLYVNKHCAPRQAHRHNGMQ